MSFSNIYNMCQKDPLLMLMQWVDARIYQIFRCCNYAFINLEVPPVKALIFDEEKIVEANIDHVIFQVRFLPDNDDTNTCTFLSLSVINPLPGALGVFIIFQNINTVMGLFALANLSPFQKMKLDV